MIVERLVIALVLIGVGVALYRLFNAWQRQRATQTAPQDPLLASAPRGVRTIVYFTTPDCAPCKLQQTPILQRLQAELGEALHVVRVDATQDTESAQRWGVMSVPTTIVLDVNGSARAVYNGVVQADKLKRDLQVA